MSAEATPPAAGHIAVRSLFKMHSYWLCLRIAQNLTLRFLGDLSYEPAKREADRMNGTWDLRHTDRQTEALVCRCVSSKWQIKIISQVIWGQRDQALRSVCFGRLLVCIKCLIHLTGQPRTRGGFGFWTCVYVWASGVILCLSVCVCVFVCLWSLHAIC